MGTQGSEIISMFSVCTLQIYNSEINNNYKMIIITVYSFSTF
uniref:Uncharacterized protein n=1 Tax=Anguilla anguilla TaxID=7936 RepID=A0A0E9W5A8_ANGAN